MLRYFEISPIFVTVFISGNENCKIILTAGEDLLPHERENITLASGYSNP